MLLTAEQLHREQPPNAWFCLKAQTRRENLAAISLRSIHIEVFCPQIRLRRATVRGAVWFREAMFPGYLFARFHYATEGRRVTYSQGISNIVHFGDRLAIIEHELLQPLIELCGREETAVIEVPLKEGDVVTILQGPMHGLEGIITRVAGARDRVAVLLKFLGREIEAEIPTPRIITKERRLPAIEKDAEK